ncbi:MAG: hypothetical protein PHT07_06015 [Paludibacter sp.]|nr:hypothetical protein [Paludibacter sp.]
MRHKVLILFFLFWTFQTLPFAQVATHRLQKYLPKLSTDSIISEKKEERIVQMKKLFQSVPGDTATKKVVSLDPDFKEKYLSDQGFNYNHEEGTKSFLKRLLEKLSLLLNKLFGTDKLSKYSDLTLIVFKILCGLVVLVALYFVIRLLMNHKGKWFFSKKNEAIPIDINNTEQLIQSADFEQLISGIEQLGDTRQIIRLYYLWLLKDLKDNELIVWVPEKTNSDYLSELKEESLRKKFSYLSYLYNYIWYGEFAIGDEDYITAKSAFLNYLKGDRQHG